MSKPSHPLLLVLGAAALLGLIRQASALTMNQPVTPAYVTDNPKQFSIVAEKRADGLLHFTIKHLVARPSYLVATTELRDGDKLLFQSTASSFVREDSVTYFVTLAPDRLAGATFELFQGSFTESDGHPTPEVGGTNFQIHLNDFAKTPPATK